MIGIQPQIRWNCQNLGDS